MTIWVVCIQPVANPSATPGQLDQQREGSAMQPFEGPNRTHSWIQEGKTFLQPEMETKACQTGEYM